jgi:energy-coupling factor transport system permease protein
MESRCYRGGKGRTRMKVLKFGIADLIGLIAVAAMYAGIIAGGL